MTDPTLYTPAEAARLLRLAPQTVRHLCSSRQLEHINISAGKQRARYLISADAIAAFRRTRTIPAHTTRAS